MKKKPGLIKGLVISVIVLAVFIGAIFFADKRLESERMENLKEAVKRSAVSCYAIEGFYPSTIDYLEKNYGLVIDRESYTVYYEAYGSNMLPDITVLKNW